MNYNTSKYTVVDIFPDVFFFVAGFFPDNVHAGRPRVGGRVRVVGVGIGFARYGVLAPKLFVILEPHARLTIFRFFFLYTALHAACFLCMPCVGGSA